MRNLVAIVFFILWLSPVSSFAASGPANEWVLRGTIVSRSPQGIAIIEHIRTGKQALVRVDEMLADGYRLTAVYNKYALVRGANRVYRLMFGQRIEDGTGKHVLSQLNTYKLKWSELQGVIKYLDVIPHQQDGKIVGYYANQIDAKLRTDIGLQRGDLVLAVNGIALDQNLDLDELYAQLGRSHYQIDVKRKGHRIQLVYEVQQ